MAAKKGNKNAEGNSGGKPYSKDNREKAATLKGLSLDWMMKVMEGNDEALKKEVVMKIATTCIPQEMRHSGSDENKTPIPIIQLETNVLPTNNSDKQDIEDDQENQDSSGRNECEQNNINNPLSDSNGSTGWKQNTN